MGLQKQTTDDRFFIVFYARVDKLNVMSLGSITAAIRDGKFPSSSDMKILVINHFPTEDSNVVISNVIEVSESDYQDWLS